MGNLTPTPSTVCVCVYAHVCLHVCLDLETDKSCRWSTLVSWEYLNAKSWWRLFQSQKAGYLKLFCTFGKHMLSQTPSASSSDFKVQVSKWILLKHKETPSPGSSQTFQGFLHHGGSSVSAVIDNMCFYGSIIPGIFSSPPSSTDLSSMSYKKPHKSYHTFSLTGDVERGLGELLLSDTQKGDRMRNKLLRFIRAWLQGKERTSLHSPPRHSQGHTKPKPT